MGAGGRIGETDVREVVAEEGQQDTPDIARRAPSFAGGRAEGNAYECQHEAGDRQGEAAVELDTCIDTFLRLAVLTFDIDPEFLGEHLFEGLGADCLHLGLLEDGGSPGCHGMVGGFVNALIFERKLDAVVRGIGNGDGFLRKRDAGAGRHVFEAGLTLGSGRQVGNKDTAPDGGAEAGFDVIHVEDSVVVGELFLEDLGDHVGGHE